MRECESKPICISDVGNFYEIFADEFELADKCIHLHDVLINNINANIGKNQPPDAYQFILTTNFIKATNSFLAIVHLINIGIVEEAATIARKVVELIIHMKYLSLDKTIRIPLYLKYGIVKRHLSMKQVLENPFYDESLKSSLREIAPNIESEYVNSKTLYDLNNDGEVKKGLVRRNWSGKPLNKMAEECGLGVDYHHAYRLASTKIHGSVEDIGNYFDFENNKFYFQCDPSRFRNWLMQSIRSYLQVCELLANSYELDLENSITDIKKGKVSLDYNSVEE